MTATGLQQFLDVSLDATRQTVTDIFIHSDDPSVGTIAAQELLEPSVETVVKVAEETLRGDHHDSIISFRFTGAEALVTCRRDSSDGIVCDRGFTLPQS
jgi:hypothetical protein